MAEQILKETAREMVDLSTKEAYQEIEEQVRPTAEMVKQAAKELTDYALELQIQKTSVLQDLAALNTANEYSVLNFSKKYIQNESEYKKLMTKVFHFQDIANEFLGQRVFMTFVSITPTSGEVTLYNMDNSIDDLSISRASAKRGGDISGRMTSLKKIKAASSQIIDSSYDKSSLDTTFQEVWQRFRISKAKLHLKGPAFILWYLGEWDGLWVSGAGPLGEAYVAFFVNKYHFLGDVEPNVKDFMTNANYGATNADNASGFLKGDITKDALQFGVKVSGAQPLQPTDIIKYAQEIQNASDVGTFLINLQKKLEADGVNNMTKTLSEFLQSDYDALFEPLKQRIDKVATNGFFVTKIRKGQIIN